MWWDREDACHGPICVKNACVAGAERDCPAGLNASMPTQMEALSDTCLQIPCSLDSVPLNLLDKKKKIYWFMAKIDSPFWASSRKCGFQR